MSKFDRAGFITKTVGLLGVAALASVISLPAFAQDSSSGPSVVEGEAMPGPSESPSGTPNVEGTSSVDDPGQATEPSMSEDSPNQPRRESYNYGNESDDTQNEGPSIVPGQAMPGPSESPSGTPNVEGTSSVDDPGQAIGQ